MSELDFLARVKTLTIIALFSDDELMERLVLKGGNLLDIVYGVSARASVDVDLSTAGDFEITELTSRLTLVLTATFAENGLVLFDIIVEEKPDKMTDDMRSFWGGYNVVFKLMEFKKYQVLKHDLPALRRNALNIGKRESTKFSVQISKFEVCEPKQRHDVEGYQIYAYSPALFVCEKIRAICQQMPEYQKLVHNHPSARARDFLDIYLVVERYNVRFDDELCRLLREVFAAKRVPIGLIRKIDDFREFHRADYPAVMATVKPAVALNTFDFYFDNVLGYCAQLKSLRDE